MKCGASKNSEGNTAKTLDCNDECARLERNRRLAVALNIDQSTHIDGGDHIPYSTETLNLFAEGVKFGQTQEREFRVFATSPDEKRLRFKPMQARQRSFIHALAEDFGMDSESMDPEPHRHVMVWKTPRFVSAPNKTLAEALRIRQAQRSANASANVSDNEGPKKGDTTRASTEPYNGFVIANPKFGLTIDELKTEVNKLLHSGMSMTFDIEFLPNEEVVLKAVSRTLNGLELQQALQGLRSQVVTAISAKTYGRAELCATDTSLNILRRECDAPSGDGWSKVAAKKAAPRIMVSAEGSRGSSNLFSALGDGKVTFAKKKPEKVKPKKEAVVEDWEAAELAEEAKEGVTSGGSAPDVDQAEGSNAATAGSDASGKADDVYIVVDEQAELAPVGDWATHVEGHD